jgi:hypothetical protein
MGYQPVPPKSGERVLRTNKQADSLFYFFIKFINTLWF